MGLSFPAILIVLFLFVFMALSFRMFTLT